MASRVRHILVQLCRVLGGQYTCTICTRVLSLRDIKKIYSQKYDHTQQGSARVELSTAFRDVMRVKTSAREGSREVYILREVS